MRILLITTRDIINSRGEWRLIANRAATLFEVYGIETDVDVLLNSNRLSSPGTTAPRTNGMTIRCQYFSGAWWTFPNYIQRYCRRLRSDNHNYDWFIVSGMLAYFIAPSLPNTKTLIDVHGVIEEHIEYPHALKGIPLVVRRLLVHLGSVLEGWTIRRSRASIVVTQQLGSYIERKYGGTAVVFPCVSRKQSHEAPLSMRLEWRERLGYHSDEIVFVYSGGLSGWQCVRESMELFQSCKRLGVKTRLLLLTLAVEDAALLAKQVGLTEMDYQVRSMHPEDAIAALYACDVALLLRRSDLTNSVAFPNKFVEYVAGGLLVLSSPGLSAIVPIIEAHGIGCLIEPSIAKTPPQEFLNTLRELLYTRGDNWAEFLLRCHVMLDTVLSADKLIEPLAGIILAPITSPVNR